VLPAQEPGAGAAEPAVGFGEFPATLLTPERNALAPRHPPIHVFTVDERGFGQQVPFDPFGTFTYSTPVASLFLHPNSQKRMPDTAALPKVEKILENVEKPLSLARLAIEPGLITLKM